jgi:RimJ/RimL family protein N-acetyltransferase
MHVFETERLRIRKARLNDEDVNFFHNIWTNPAVMVLVGFPEGLRITREDIRASIRDQDGTEYDKKLVVELKETSKAIGECKLGTPDERDVSETDVKLLPEYWGKGFGTEIKRGLVNYLFENTDCKSIKATPNKNNIASQKMQEAVGGRRVGEGVFEFPEEMKDYTIDVPYYLYVVYKEDWVKSE